MDLRSFLRKTIPKIRKTEQKTFPRSDPAPGNIFIKEKKRKPYDRQNRHNMAKTKKRVRKLSITQTPALWHLRVKMQGLFVSFSGLFLLAGSGE